MNPWYNQDNTKRNRIVCLFHMTYVIRDRDYIYNLRTRGQYYYENTWLMTCYWATTPSSKNIKANVITFDLDIWVVTEYDDTYDNKISTSWFFQGIVLIVMCILTY